MGKRVNVLLAVYKPEERWLRNLLRSLNEQSYGNIELSVYDDCPECRVDKRIFEEEITAFDFNLVRGEKNLGSNKAFEYLTKTASGDYFAYCDQDDVWHSEKIEKMVKKAEETGAALVCHDLNVIDGDDNLKFTTYKAVSKRHVFEEGDKVYNTLLVRNFAVGCASLYRADAAKKAVPFCEGFFHDHWLALVASLNGYVAFIDESLIDYRIHGSNQTGIFLGIENKNDYFEKRIKVFFDRTKNMMPLLQKYGTIADSLKEMNEWANARYDYFKHKNLKYVGTLLKYRKFGFSLAWFEILMPFIPNWIFGKIVGGIKKGKL